MCEFIKINVKDDVVVLLNDSKKGDIIKVDAKEIEVLQDTPKGHKIAIKNIEKDNVVLKYGYSIGKAIGLAGLIRFYQVEKTEDGYVGYDFNGNGYNVFDTPEVLEFMYNVNKKYEIKNEEYIKEILSEKSLWGEDLSVYTGMVESVYENLKDMGI